MTMGRRKPLPHKIDARLATRVVSDLRRHGVNADSLLKEVGLRRADVSDEGNRISYAAVLGLIERAAITLGDASYGLRLGAAHEARDSGMLGFLMLNSPTLLDALGNVERYVRVLGEGEDIEIERLGPRVTLRFRETEKALRGLRHNSEYIAAILVRACRDMTRKRISPVRAEFMHARPNGKVAYADYLGCPVKFHSEWDALVYDAATLHLPVIGADSKLFKVLERACQRILGPTPRKRDILHDVRELVIDRLAKGAVQFDAVARELNMSSKTLERRLADRKTTFSTLLDDARSGLAKHYLTDTDLRLEQIAYLTGYSEPAALVRAFRRWTGTTPMQFRSKRS
jgi:AraC-like DNA-binding protein